jgi:hypothetical protein
MNVPDNLVKLVKGENIGTLIQNLEEIEK